MKTAESVKCPECGEGMISTADGLYVCDKCWLREDDTPAQRGQ